MSPLHERRLRLADNSTITHQGEIDNLMSKRDYIRKLRASEPPNKKIQDLDISQATLRPAKARLDGILQMLRGDKVVFENPLNEIADISIDLSPEADMLPRQLQYFELIFPDRILSVEVAFSDTSSRYWPFYAKKRRTNVFSGSRSTQQLVLST